MRIDHQILTGVSSPARAAATAQRWLVGQLLTIGVIGRLDESSIRLSVDGQELLARTPLDLQPGTSLRARVLTAGAQPLLQILDPKPSAAPTTDAAKSTPAIVRSALGNSLPLQQPLQEVFGKLALQTTAEIAPPTLRAQVAALTGTLPDLPALAQPANLARAVAAAGSLLEATLAAQDPPVGAPQSPAPPLGHDLKFQLLALREAIDVELARLPRDTATPTARADARPGGREAQAAVSAPHAALRALAEEVDAGIARITTHQLQHLAAAERGDFYAFAEVPFRTSTGNATLSLAIDADDAASGSHDGKESGQGAMAVNLAVPVPDVGELRARIGLSGERLALTLWSEDPALRELMVEDIGLLEARLAGLGFELTPIVMRELDAPDPLRRLPSRLVDTSI